MDVDRVVDDDGVGGARKVAAAVAEVYAAGEPKQQLECDDGVEFVVAVADCRDDGAVGDGECCYWQNPSVGADVVAAVLQPGDLPLHHGKELR